jgi:hypothetical protein
MTIYFNDKGIPHITVLQRKLDNWQQLAIKQEHQIQELEARIKELEGQLEKWQKFYVADVKLPKHLDNLLAKARQQAFREVGSYINNLDGKCAIGLESNTGDRLEWYQRFSSAIEVLGQKLEQGELPKE